MRYWTIHRNTLHELLQPLKNVIEDLLRGGLAAQVGRQELAGIEVGINGRVDLGGSGLLTQELQHQRNTAQSGDRVGDALALDIGSTAVAGLTDSEAVTDVGTGDETQATNQGGSTVRQNVTVQVGSNDHIVVLGLAEELVDHGINNLLLNLDGGELLGSQSLARGLAEEAISLRQDVGLVSDGNHGLGASGGSGSSVADLLTAQRNLTGHSSDAGGGALRDALDSLGNLAVGGIMRALLLHVEVLSVLADDNQVDGSASGRGGPDRTHIGVQVELLAESDNRRRVTGNLGAGGAGERHMSGWLPLI